MRKCARLDPASGFRILIAAFGVAFADPPGFGRVFLGRKAFELPASVDQGKISADFSKGVLTITLAKTPEAQKQQKKIEVKST